MRHQSGTDFKGFFELTSDCQFYLEADAEGALRYRQVNPAALSVTNFESEAELLGLTPLEALGEDYGSTVETNVRKAFEGREVFRFTGPIGSDATSPVYDAYYYPVTDNRGHVIGVLGTARDITAIQSLKEQTHHNEKLEILGEVVGNVAHDFNNILNVMQGVLRTVGREDVSQERRNKALEYGHRALENGVSLTRQLTSFARKERIHAVPHDMARLISACEGLVRKILGESIRLSLDLQPDLWEACCDRTEFELCLLNLAKNARDAIEGSGSVSIVARNRTLEGDSQPLQGDYVAIQFADTGAGMPDHVLARATEPFFTTKPEGKGTGLGLSNLARFVEQIGGKITIESVLGHGTTVTIWLQRA